MNLATDLVKNEGGSHNANDRFGMYLVEICSKPVVFWSVYRPRVGQNQIGYSFHGVCYDVLYDLCRCLCPPRIGEQLVGKSPQRMYHHASFIRCTAPHLVEQLHRTLPLPAFGTSVHSGTKGKVIRRHVFRAHDVQQCQGLFPSPARRHGAAHTAEAHE